MTIQEILRTANSSYKLSPLDAEILLSLAANLPREFLYAHPEKKIPPAQMKKFSSFARRRSSGEPIAYIIGKKEFYGFYFFVNKNVLIPRPETELLVEKTICNLKNFFCHPAIDAGSRKKDRLNSRFRGDDKAVVIDIGTGSGNIIISITKNLPEEIRKKINFYAVDISKKSLKIAEENARKHKVNKKIKFIRSDLLKYFLKNKIESKNIFIVANLPYVSPDFYRKNKKNLRFEPKDALISKQRGLKHYERLFRQIKKILITDHYSLITGAEISPEQKPEISRILGKYLPKTKTKFLKDLTGKWRMAYLEV